MRDSDKIEPEDFAALVAAHLIESQIVTRDQIQLERQEFILLIKNNIGRVRTRILLTNFYDEYCEGDAARRQDILQRIRTQTDEPPGTDNFEEMKLRIYPHITSRWAVEEVNFKLKYGKIGEADSDVTHGLECMGFADHFAIVVAENLPETRRLLDKRTLSGFGLSFPDVMDLASQNLLRDSEFQFDTHLIDKKPVCYESRWKDGFDASRILFLDQLKGLPTDGHMIVAMPTNNELMITGSNDQIGLAFLLNRTSQWKETIRNLPPIMVSLEDGKYKKWLPNNPDVLEVLNRIECEYLYELYESQSRLLDSIFDVVSGNLVVVPYQLVELSLGILRSLTVVTNEVTPLIPKTDFVCFSKTPLTSKVLARARWDRVVSQLGDSVEATTHYPPRYKLNRFPTDAELAGFGIQSFLG